MTAGNRLSDLRLSIVRFTDYVAGENVAIPGDRVCFLAADGRVMFEVSVVDGRTISIHSHEACKVDGVLYSSELEIRPRVTNVIEVRTVPYE